LELRKAIIPQQIRELKAEFLGLLVRECDAKGEELKAIQKRKKKLERRLRSWNIYWRGAI